MHHEAWRGATGIKRGVGGKRDHVKGCVQKLDRRFRAGDRHPRVLPESTDRTRAKSDSYIVAAVGQAGVFYMGMPLGGVWKTTSAGQTWYPVFDSIKEVSSVGSIQVAPSDPNIIYAGTGDIVTGGGINEGNGVYKSTDAGKTWKHVGLDATKQIPSMLVDPRDPNIVLVAAQGDIHVKSETRGVYRSSDGGATWTKTLF